MRLITSFLLLLCSLSAAYGTTKVIYNKGDTKLIRSKETLLLKKGLTLLHGDKIMTGDSGLVIIKSRASTYKISKNSYLILDLKTEEIINSNINYGSAVIEFARRKLVKSVGKTLTVKTRTAAFGVRGTKFFSYVDKKNKNSILSVEHGKVAFKGSASKKETLVKKNKSSMTNIKKKHLESKRFGFENKINWNLSSSKGKLSQNKKLFSELEKTWKRHKHDQAKKWNKQKNDMKSRWEQMNNQSM